MAKEKQTWRKTGGVAILCDPCGYNEVNENGEPLCTAPDGICVFSRDRVDSQETWSNFTDVYAKPDGSDDDDPKLCLF